MAKKKVFALRLDEEVYLALERWAADEFRSTNGQLEWIIGKALKEARRANTQAGNAESDNKK